MEKEENQNNTYPDQSQDIKKETIKTEQNLQRRDKKRNNFRRKSKRSRI